MSNLEETCKRLGVPRSVFEGSASPSPALAYEIARDEATRAWQQGLRDAFEAELLPRLIETVNWRPFFLFPKTKKMLLVRCFPKELRIEWT